ncbi:MAG: SpoIIE family protein phosphatase [bacterium]|nr:MAG: SpoIIE family protein phosphatase [bacterium]
MVERENENRLTKLEKENQRLRTAIDELTVLNDIATAIGSTIALEEVIDLMVRKCIKHLKVEQGTVTLLDTNENKDALRTMVRRADTSRYVLPYHLDTQITGWMLKNKKPLLINDFSNDNRFQKAKKENYPIRSLLSVPLLLKGRMIGTLNVFNKKTDEAFTEEDKRMITIIASQSAQIIENARLYEEEQTLMHIREEMRLAYKIQTDLLPKTAPDVAGYEIAGKSLPAKSVGGDYFDFVEADPKHLALCLGDVSGKGMPAALLMSNLQATLRGQITQQLSPKKCLEHSNKIMFRNTDPFRFATLFYGVLDSEKHELQYANAGHNPPFLIKSGKDPVRLGTGGIVLGIIEDFTYPEEHVPFDTGDILVVYSDGVTEAFDDKDEEFGEERLISMVKKYSGDPVEQIIEKIIGAVQHHTVGVQQMDDITLIIVKRTE